MDVTLIGLLASILNLIGLIMQQNAGTEITPEQMSAATAKVKAAVDVWDNTPTPPAL